MELTIVNPSPKWPPAEQRQPLRYGYLHIGAAVAPPNRSPFPGPSSARAALLDHLKVLASELERLDPVVRATIYRAVLVPPAGNNQGEPLAHPARFDVTALVETRSPEDITEVRTAEPYRRLVEAVGAAAQDVQSMAARCVRLIADVDKSPGGLFLFNHFIAQDPGVALELWDRLAGWYAVETGLDNSTLLQPIGQATYTLVNHARWDRGLQWLMMKQFSTPSFWTYVRANLEANQTVSMPVLYRRA